MLRFELRMLDSKSRVITTSLHRIQLLLIAACVSRKGGNEAMKSMCFDCESNTGPSDLQSDALPTELQRLLERRCTSQNIIVFCGSEKYWSHHNTMQQNDHLTLIHLHYNNQLYSAELPSFPSLSAVHYIVLHFLLNTIAFFIVVVSN